MATTAQANICTSATRLVYETCRQPWAFVVGAVVVSGHWSLYYLPQNMLREFSQSAEPKRSILLSTMLVLLPFGASASLAGDSAPYDLHTPYHKIAFSFELLLRIGTFAVATYPFVKMALNFKPYKQMFQSRQAIGRGSLAVLALLLINVFASIPMLDAAQSADPDKYGNAVNYIAMFMTFAAPLLIAIPGTLDWCLPEGHAVGIEAAEEPGITGTSRYVDTAAVILLLLALLPAALSAHAVFHSVCLQIICSVCVLPVLAIPLFKPLRTEMQRADITLWGRVISRPVQLDAGPSTASKFGERLFCSTGKLAANFFYSLPNLFFLEQFFCNAPDKCQHIEWLYTMMLVTYVSSLAMNIYLLEGLLQEPLQDLCASIQKSKATCISIWSKVSAGSDVEQQAEVKLLSAA